MLAGAEGNDLTCDNCTTLDAALRADTHALSEETAKYKDMN